MNDIIDETTISLEIDMNSIDQIIIRLKEKGIYVEKVISRQELMKHIDEMGNNLIQVQ